MPKEFEPVRETEGQKFERIAVQTHWITFGEDIVELLRKYAVPIMQPGDWVALSEKVISVCQNNVRHISNIKTTWLARLITKGVRKYPNDPGWDNPPKMQVVIDEAGAPRVILAMVLGAIGKLIGIRGIFWHVVGHRLGEIDGPYPKNPYPYNEYSVLPPKDPKGTCDAIEKELNLPAVIIDGNNINIKIIGMSKGMPVNATTARLALLDNPMGQEEEKTPFILVRKIK